MVDVNVLADPRMPPDAAAALPAHARLHALAVAALDAPTRVAAEAADDAIRRELARMLEKDGDALAALFATAPSVPVTRHLWRLLDALWRDGPRDASSGLSLALFALPVVIVTGREVEEPLRHPAILADAGRLAAILREHRAFNGAESFALASSLVAADAFEPARLPDLYSWQRLPETADGDAPVLLRELQPATIDVREPGESVHLRFVVGSILTRRDADPLVNSAVGRWGLPLARALSEELTLPGASVLAIPRAPQHPLPAVAAGRAVQREVGAQLFASSAIRKLRAAAGEPAAVISAHRAPDATGGGELRLSLSSPFAPRDAEGFRCPLYPLDRAVDVATMLLDLLSDCRVTNVRVAAGVHPDRDPATGRTLLFKPDTLPGAALH